MTSSHHLLLSAALCLVATASASAPAALPGWLRVNNFVAQSDSAASTSTDTSMDMLGYGLDGSADGSVIVASAPGKTLGPALVGAGEAYAFYLGADSTGAKTGFQPFAVLRANDAAAGDAFGSDIASSADASTIVVGAPGAESGSVLNTGATYVFTFDATTGTYKQQQALETSDKAADDAFGSSVAVSADGDMLVSCASGADLDATHKNVGKCYIFTRAAGLWTQVKILMAPTPKTNDNFGGAGGAIAVWSDSSNTVAGVLNYILVGCPGRDSTSASDSGSAFLFATTTKQGFAGMSTTPVNELLPKVSTTSSLYGSAIALFHDGTATSKITAVVGAINDDLRGTAVTMTGSISGTTLTITSTPLPTTLAPGTLISGAGVAIDMVIVSGSLSSYKVSVSQPTAVTQIAISATPIIRSNCGTLTTFVLSSASAAPPSSDVVAFASPDSSDNQAFGASFSFSNDGLALAVGAQGAFFANQISGEVLVLKRTALTAAAWTSWTPLYSQSSNAGDLLGAGVVASGNANDGTLTVAASAQASTGDQYDFVNSGNIYLFVHETTPKPDLPAFSKFYDVFPAQVATSTVLSHANMGPFAGAAFGTSLSASGDMKRVVTGSASYNGLAGTVVSGMTGSITGTTLTLTLGAPTTALAAGMLLLGTGVVPGTTIVSGSGSTYVVSAKQTVTSTATLSASPTSGAFFLLSYSAAGYSVSAPIVSQDLDSGDALGSDIVITPGGMTVVVGANMAEDSIVNSGKTYIFKDFGSSPFSVQLFGVDGPTPVDGTFTAGLVQVAGVVPSTSAANDNFGSSVAVSDDGSVVVSCSMNEDFSAAVTDSGACYVLTLGLASGAPLFGTISADLTLTLNATATLPVGAVITGMNVAPGTKIVSGSGTSYVVDTEPLSKEIGVISLLPYGSIATASTTVLTLTAGAPITALKAGTLIFGPRIAENTYIKSGSGSSYVVSKSQTAAAGPIYALIYTETAKLVADVRAANDQFGGVDGALTVSGDGRTVLVGAPGKDAGSVPNAGAAFIFEALSDDLRSWTPGVRLYPATPTSDSQFGTMVALSNDATVAVVGASSDNVNGKSSVGSVTVFGGAAGAGAAGVVSWANADANLAITSQLLSSPDGKDGDLVGMGLAISDDNLRLVVGAPGASTQAAASGAVYTFSRLNGDVTQPFVWETLIAPTTAADSDGASFGYNVKLGTATGSSVALAVSSIAASYTQSGGSNPTDFNTGVVTLFGTSAVLGTTSQSVLPAQISTREFQEQVWAVENDPFGAAMQATGDGSNMLACSPYKSLSASVLSSGQCYYLAYDAASTGWLLQSTITASDAASGDTFGSDAAANHDGSVAVVGAMNAENTVTGSGKTYSYFVTDANAVCCEQSLVTSDAAANDAFGSSVAVNAAEVNANKFSVMVSCSSNADTVVVSSGLTGIISATTLTFSAGAPAKPLPVGTVITGTGVTDTMTVSTVITGGSGNTYSVSPSQHVASTSDLKATMPNTGKCYVFASAGLLATVTGSIASGILTITAGAPTTKLADGTLISGTGISAGAKINTCTSVTSCTVTGTGITSPTTGLSIFAYSPYVEVAKLTAPNAKPNDNFGGAGGAVSISDDGNVILVGSPNADYPVAVVKGKIDPILSTTTAKLTLNTATTLLKAGQVLSGFGVTAGTTIVSGSGKVYIVDTTQTVTSTYITASVPNAGTAFIYRTTVNNVFTAWTAGLALPPTMPVASSNYGVAVSLSSDGHVAVIGASADTCADDTTPSCGSVSVFTAPAIPTLPAWAAAPTPVLIYSPNSMSSQGFGSAMSLTGFSTTSSSVQRLAVGAANSDLFGSNAGAVYTFLCKNGAGGGAWVHEATVYAPAPTPGDNFGSSVSLSNTQGTALGNWFGGSDLLSVGNPFSSHGSELQVLPAAQSKGGPFVLVAEGSILAFQLSLPSLSDGGFGANTPQAVMPPSPSDAGAFGAALATSGDAQFIVSSAPSATLGPGLEGAGQAFVLQYNGSMGYVVVAALSAQDANAGDSFGSAVAINSDGSVVVVSAMFGGTGSTANAGLVYVFARCGGSYVQVAELTALDASENDFFGSSVAINADGSVIAACSPGANMVDPTALPAVDAPNGGKCYVFHRFETGPAHNWTLVATLASPSPNANDGFGGNNGGVSISDDGNTILVGVPGITDDSGATGIPDQAYIFSRNVPAAAYPDKPATAVPAWNAGWSVQQLLSISPGAGMDQGISFGWMVSLSGDGLVAAIGAASDDFETTLNCGSVTVFVAAQTQQLDSMGAPVVDANKNPVMVTEWDMGVRFIGPDAQTGDAFGSGLYVGPYMGATPGFMYRLVVGAPGDAGAAVPLTASISGSSLKITNGAPAALFPAGTSITGAGVAPGTTITACRSPTLCTVSPGGQSVASTNSIVAWSTAPNAGAAHTFISMGAQSGEWVWEQTLLEPEGAGLPQDAELFGYCVGLGYGASGDASLLLATTPNGMASAGGLVAFSTAHAPAALAYPQNANQACSATVIAPVVALSVALNGIDMSAVVVPLPSATLAALSAAIAAGAGVTAANAVIGRVRTDTDSIIYLNPMLSAFYPPGSRRLGEGVRGGARSLSAGSLQVDAVLTFSSAAGAGAFGSAIAAGGSVAQNFASAVTSSLAGSSVPSLASASASVPTVKSAPPAPPVAAAAGSRSLTTAAIIGLVVGLGGGMVLVCVCAMFLCKSPQAIKVAPAT